MASPEEAQQTQTKRYRGRNNVMVWWELQLAHKPKVKETGAELKKKAHTQAIPSPKKKRDIENENPMTHPHHKELNKQKNA